MDELIKGINEDSTDFSAIKNQLKADQEECCKLYYKLKTSANLLDKVVKEKNIIEVEKETIKSQLEQFNSVLKINGLDKRPHSLNVVQSDYKKTLKNTDALLFEISYSDSENSSSYGNEIKVLKPSLIEPNSVTTENYNKNKNYNNKVGGQINILNNPQIKVSNISNKQSIAKTTMTVGLDILNAESIIQTRPVQSSKDSSIPLSNFDSWLSSSTENEVKFKNVDDQNIKKKHNFVKTSIIVPEICGGCHTKIKLNSFIMKCLDCKIVGHLECKNHIPGICTLSQYLNNALNCHVPIPIVYCINEIERRGFDTIGLYRISGSNKEVKNLKEQFRKSLPNLDKVDIHVLCGCLKVLIRMDTDDLIPPNNFLKFADMYKNNEDVSKSFCQVVNELPLLHRSILAFLILHLKKIADSSKCCMDYKCLAIVFAPIIVGISSTSIKDIQIKTEIVINVVLELLKLNNDFWISVLNTETSSEKLPCIPVQRRSPSPSISSSSSGRKRHSLEYPPPKKFLRILNLKNRFHFNE